MPKLLVLAVAVFTDLGTTGLMLHSDAPSEGPADPVPTDSQEGAAAEKCPEACCCICYEAINTQATFSSAPTSRPRCKKEGKTRQSNRGTQPDSGEQRSWRLPCGHHEQCCRSCIENWNSNRRI